MKKIQRVSLLCLILIMLVTSTGCRCVPTSVEWYLFSYVKDVEFIGGVTRQFGFSKASIIYPFVNADFTNGKISFSENGAVSFETYEGENLNGTYTYEHVGNYTKIHIAFENGETIQADAMNDLEKQSKLVFNFRNVKYTFTNQQIEVEETMDEIVKSVKDGKKDGLHLANVVKSEEGYDVRFSELVAYPIIAEQTAVYAIRIHEDGTYSILDEVLEGDVLSTYNNDADYVILYYID